jgi:non-specific serine/threonine protein kinase
VEAGLRLGHAMAWFWAQRGYHHEGRARFSTLLARAQERTAPRAWGLRQAGYMALRQGDYANALPLLEVSVAAFRELGDRAGVSSALVALGEVLFGQLDLRRGKLLVEEGLTLAREVGDWTWLQSALSRLGDMALRLEDHDQALTCYRETLAVCREHGYQHGIAYALRGLGQLARIQDDQQRATVLLRESLEHFVELKDKRCTPLCLEGLACVASRLGQAERAARLFGATEALRESGGLEELAAVQADEREIAVVRSILGQQAAGVLWAEGRAMTLTQATEYALADEVRPGPAPGVSANPTSLLTPREQQVAILIARGFTNRQIGADLIVAESTAERHVANIMDKLGVNARAQVAVWAAEHKLILPGSETIAFTR